MVLGWVIDTAARLKVQVFTAVRLLPEFPLPSILPDVRTPNRFGDDVADGISVCVGFVKTHE